MKEWREAAGLGEITGAQQLAISEESKASVQKNISHYAATNAREVFAESFAVYAHPDYRKGWLPEGIEKFMDKYVGR